MVSTISLNYHNFLVGCNTPVTSPNLPIHFPPPPISPQENDENQLIQLIPPKSHLAMDGVTHIKAFTIGFREISCPFLATTFKAKALAITSQVTQDLRASVVCVVVLTWEGCKKDSPKNPPLSTINSVLTRSFPPTYHPILNDHCIIARHIPNIQGVMMNYRPKQLYYKGNPSKSPLICIVWYPQSGSFFDPCTKDVLP